MTRTEIVGHLKTLTTNMNVFALAIWLDGFLSERNTAPLLRCPNNPNLAEGSWLALYLHDLPPELQTKFMDAVDTVFKLIFNFFSCKFNRYLLLRM